MKNQLWLVAVVILSILSGIVACNYTVGDCYPRGQGDGSGDVGSGVVNSTGPGNPGDDPSGGLPNYECNAPEQSGPSNSGSQGGMNNTDTSGADGVVEFCNDPNASQCMGLPAALLSFDTSVFKFVTVIADDGKDAAGGWQRATATLGFVRVDGSESWTCTITVGMPLRAEAVGVITHDAAANVTAAIANQAWRYLRENSPDLPPGIFCSSFKAKMTELFSDKKSATHLLGAKMEANP